MNNLSQRTMKTGDDPRALVEYIALHDELHKLSYPGRQDINWSQVQKRCLALFERNGMELQTLAWYTQARTQLAGLSGLNEGLAMLEVLIGQRWEAVWPQSMQERVDILSRLSQQLQHQMRTLPIRFSDLNLSLLYHAGDQLVRLNEMLQRLELKSLSQFDLLAALVHNIVDRLENSDEAGVSSTTVEVPETVFAPAAVTPEARAVAPRAAVVKAPKMVKWNFVAHPPSGIEAHRRAEAAPASPAGWKLFTSGMLVMLAVGSAAQWGWHAMQDPLRLQLEASIAPLAVPLTAAEVKALRTFPALPDDLLQQTQAQLTRIESLDPDWPLLFGQQLIGQLQYLRPQEDEQVKTLANAWQQRLHAVTLPTQAMSGWHQGMAQLRQLSEKLNTLDGQPGKYMTVSELKSVVYNATKAFNRAVPVEEQLRLYSLNPSAIHKRKVEMALEQVQTQYFLLRQDKDRKSL